MLRFDSWGKLLSTSGSLAETFGAEQPFRYRGYVYDEETGWYYLQSRYYNPEVGRFISADVYLSTGQGVLGHNAYAYCGNNPMNNSDPSGYSWISQAMDWVKDAWNWTKDAASDAWKWTKGAASDAWKWTKGAANDEWNWTKGAVNDAWNCTAQEATDTCNWISVQIIV